MDFRNGDKTTIESILRCECCVTGGKIDAAFIVYDTGLVDDHEFFQWPLGRSSGRPSIMVENEMSKQGRLEFGAHTNRSLFAGVATYRGFGPLDSHKLDVESSRPYKCNFLGTVYPKSSRKILMDFIRKQKGFDKV